MVAAFKKPGDHLFSKDHKNFNQQLASLCIISEHYIGMLKDHFSWLRSICMNITNKEESLTRKFQLIEATTIIHNMMIDFREIDGEE